MNEPGIFISKLNGEQAEEVLNYWKTANPLHPLDLAMIEERLFGPPEPDGDMLLAARDEAGRLVGIAAGVYPCRKVGTAGIRWMGALPGTNHDETFRLLLDALLPLLAARGAAEVHLFATPPHYIRPGIDTRETDLIAMFQSLGWQHAATHFNMTCDLAKWERPEEPGIFAADREGYTVRRGEPENRDALRDLIQIHWTVGWRDAASLAFRHDPISVFIAERNREIVGFAAYEVDQCLGSFGPTGVVPAHQGHGLGARLLNACLADLQNLGRKECLIGWVGPVGFYHKACGATLGPAYWMMSKAIAPDI